MNNFNSLGLPEILLQSLKSMQFHEPTKVQAEAIPVALKGHDIIGSSQTGTGKTMAFGIPLVSYVLNSPENRALVVVPTREIALQVLKTLRQLIVKDSSIGSVLLIGGDPIIKQLKQLKAKPRIIVGTPGRINDHLSRQSLNLGDTKFVVFDEIDRMLDLGFTVQLQQITKALPHNRQTLMFSATMAPNIINVAQKYLKDPVRISVGSASKPVEQITQEALHLAEGEKHNYLLQCLDQFYGSCVVFVKTKRGAENLAGKLRDKGHNVNAIHGDLRQKNRERVIKHFRDGRSRILVATDIAARGLDIPHIQCVINYDLPQCPEDYIHRIGRTGRAGATGKAISLITPQDNGKWKDICKMMDPETKGIGKNTGQSASATQPQQGKKKQYGKSKRRNNSASPHFKSRAGRNKPRSRREKV